MFGYIDLSYNVNNNNSPITYYVGRGLQNQQTEQSFNDVGDLQKIYTSILKGNWKKRNPANYREMIDDGTTSLFKENYQTHTDFDYMDLDKIQNYNTGLVPKYLDIYRQFNKKKLTLNNYSAKYYKVNTTNDHHIVQIEQQSIDFFREVHLSPYSDILIQSVNQQLSYVDLDGASSNYITNWTSKGNKLFITFINSETVIFNDIEDLITSLQLMPSNPANKLYNFYDYLNNSSDATDARNHLLGLITNINNFNNYNVLVNSKIPYAIYYSPSKIGIGKFNFNILSGAGQTASSANDDKTIAIIHSVNDNIYVNPSNNGLPYAIVDFNSGSVTDENGNSFNPDISLNVEDGGGIVVNGIKYNGTYRFYSNITVTVTGYFNEAFFMPFNFIKKYNDFCTFRFRYSNDLIAGSYDQRIAGGIPLNNYLYFDYAISNDDEYYNYFLTQKFFAWAETDMVYQMQNPIKKRQIFYGYYNNLSFPGIPNVTPENWKHIYLKYHPDPDGGDALYYPGDSKFNPDNTNPIVEIVNPTMKFGTFEMTNSRYGEAGTIKGDIWNSFFDEIKTSTNLYIEYGIVPENPPSPYGYNSDLTYQYLLDEGLMVKLHRFPWLRSM
tara:strand:+ start:7149 stop:8975 length:1827 start_codon:yes stop_codon:yes gene_type:complete